MSDLVAGPLTGSREEVGLLDAPQIILGPTEKENGSMQPNPPFWQGSSRDACSVCVGGWGGSTAELLLVPSGTLWAKQQRPHFLLLLPYFLCHT